MNRHVKKARELIGARYDRLVIQTILSERTNDGHILAQCLCDCGLESTPRLSYLKNGKTRSCGCLNAEVIIPNLKRAQKLQKTWEPRLGSARKVYHNRYADSDISFDEFLFLSQKNCFYCNSEPSRTYNAYSYRGSKHSEQRIVTGAFTYNGLDRIDSSLNHAKNNVVTCCAACNTAKMGRSVPEFLCWIKKVYKFQMVQNNDFDREQSS